MSVGIHCVESPTPQGSQNSAVFLLHGRSEECPGELHDDHQSSESDWEGFYGTICSTDIKFKLHTGFSPKKRACGEDVLPICKLWLLRASLVSCC